jgi:hypothetical protein
MEQTAIDRDHGRVNELITVRSTEGPDTERRAIASSCHDVDRADVLLTSSTSDSMGV